MTKRGLLLVISGPSGSGKGTVVREIMKKDPDFALSISATTRTPREGELHGVHYYFISREEFKERIAADMMLEHAEYCGNFYGTPKKEVLENLEAGKNVILEIDVQGGLQIKQKFPEVLLLMVVTPDFATLEKRLRGRGDQVEEQVLKDRLAMARKELAHLPDYDYVIVNEEGEIEKTADEVIGIVHAEQKKTCRCEDFIRQFYAE